MSWDEVEGVEWLITGGTGSLGKAIVEYLLRNKEAKGIRIYSRDEYKQWKMKQFIQENYGRTAPVSFLIGDVRDKERLSRALNGVDYVTNAAAMKQVPACEDDPMEAIKTNINGAMNVINCSIDAGVKKVMHISTDKAVYPINLYGATKTVAEKLFIDGNTYAPERTLFSCCRYGNVLGSRGSLIQLIQEKIKANQPIPLTHPDMTRFFVSLKTMVPFIIDKLLTMEGSEIFIPEMQSCRIIDLISCFGKDLTVEEIGIREGEKLHEDIISSEEIKHTKRYFGSDKKFGYFMITSDINPDYKEGMNKDSLNSFNNTHKLEENELQDFIKDFMEENNGANNV